MGYVADKDGKQVSVVGYINDFLVHQSDDSWTITDNVIDRRVPSYDEIKKITDEYNAKLKY